MCTLDTGTPCRLKAAGTQMRHPRCAVGVQDLFSIAVDQPFRFPATFTFVLRAFSTLEGVGKTLDPDFSFPRIAAPYAQVKATEGTGWMRG